MWEYDWVIIDEYSLKLWDLMVRGNVLESGYIHQWYISPIASEEKKKLFYIFGIWYFYILLVIKYTIISLTSSKSLFQT